MTDTAQNPFITETEALDSPARSIVDEVFNLDSFLSGDVRRAERTAQFCTRPELEARLGELHAELERLTDSQGRARPVVDQSMEDGRSARAVASEMEALQEEYGAAMAIIRMRAMIEDDWIAFQARQKKAMDEGDPFPAEFYEDLITSSEPRITMPGGKSEPVSLAQLKKLRQALGHAAFNEIAQTAWAVNTISGVSIPKSALSSAVLREQRQG